MISVINPKKSVLGPAEMTRSGFRWWRILTPIVWFAKRVAPCLLNVAAPCNVSRVSKVTECKYVTFRQSFWKILSQGLAFQQGLLLGRLQSTLLLLLLFLFLHLPLCLLLHLPPRFLRAAPKTFVPAMKTISSATLTQPIVSMIATEIGFRWMRAPLALNAGRVAVLRRSVVVA